MGLPVATPCNNPVATARHAPDSVAEQVPRPAQDPSFLRGRESVATRAHMKDPGASGARSNKLPELPKAGR